MYVASREAYLAIMANSGPPNILAEVIPMLSNQLAQDFPLGSVIMIGLSRPYGYRFHDSGSLGSPASGSAEQNVPVRLL